MTSSTVIDGKTVATSIIDMVKAAVVALETENGVKTGACGHIVGDDPASHSYVAAKSRMAKECGFASLQHTLPAAATQDELALW